MATILIVDDREPDRELLVTLLNYAQHRVIEAASGVAALQLIRTERPDLVISDVLLPSMDGYELVRQLRSDPQLSRTAVMFYTAVFNEQEARDLAQDCGVSRILSKPTEPEKILQAVEEVLSASETDRISSPPPHFDHRHQQLLIDKLMHQVDALRLSEERFRLLAENATDMVFRYRVKPDRVWEYVNPAAGAILGYVPQEYYDNPGLQLEIVHPDSRDELERCLNGKPAPTGTMHIGWIHKEGRTVWTEIHSTPLFDEGGNLVVLEGIVRDISERKEMEEELRKTCDHLEQRVEIRTTELARANAELQAYALRLEKLNQELQEFTFVASHDLQEPLRKIQVFGNRLQSHFNDSLGDQGKDYLRRMTSAADRMSSLLKALLNYSRVSMRPNPFTPTDLTTVVNDAVTDLELVIEKSGAQVEIGELATAEVDSNQMRQLFQNLIGNSLKYHRRDEPPVVKLHGEMADGVCRVFVTDNGIGFDEKYLERIFAPFQRLHGRGEYEGTGMGLAICRKIVERHQGSITAKSTQGEGSVFIITLPLVQPDDTTP